MRPLTSLLSTATLLAIVALLSILLGACSDNITTVTTRSTTTTAPSSSPETTTSPETGGTQPLQLLPGETYLEELPPGQTHPPVILSIETTTPPPDDQEESSQSAPSDETGSGTNTGGTTSGSVTTTTWELAEAAFTSSSKVTTVGIDEVYFGDWYKDAAVKVRTEWVGIPEEGTVPECLVVTPINGPEGIEVWLYRGYVERIDIVNAELRTRSGYGIGTTLDELREALGDRLRETENDDGTISAEFVPSDPGDAVFRIAFEVGEDGTVQSYRSGRASLINEDRADCE